MIEKLVSSQVFAGTCDTRVGSHDMICCLYRVQVVVNNRLDQAIGVCLEMRRYDGARAMIEREASCILVLMLNW